MYKLNIPSSEWVRLNILVPERQTDKYYLPFLLRKCYMIATLLHNLILYHLIEIKFSGMYPIHDNRIPLAQSTSFGNIGIIFAPLGSLGTLGERTVTKENPAIQIIANVRKSFIYPTGDFKYS